MRQTKLGKWTINFDLDYRIIKDNNTLIVVDNDRHPCALISINDSGSLRIERTYYPMMYEVVTDDNVVNFITVED
ncbi:hypothetical protein AN641_09725 [Candidatus Epulonipiscioides gigas]|nr:hypothetical protein AN641_09725 [Epulopiscium sp. SCG-C07WGA-EpuloA2]